jgi:hypothetical protein
MAYGQEKTIDGAQAPRSNHFRAGKRLSSA